MAGDSPQDPAIHIHPIRPEDAPALTAILQEAPETVNWLPEVPATPPVATTSGAILVAEREGETVGFVMVRHVADESEIHNIVVRRSDRRSGVGAALLAAALTNARQHGATRVFLEVRESNAAAIAFYRSQGFHSVGRRGRYYRNPDEDALLFERKLTG